MHGRREGQAKNGGLASELPRIGLVAQGINPNEVAVFQPKDWQRIQNNLARYNEASEKAEQKRRDRENLHAASKELVKHWENTIEGQRLKKLQARKLREEQEEEERKKIDIEEAKIQAQKRKEAIERAKQQQYYETDRVKGFHGALLLTEVLKERDAQIAFKNSRQDFQKERENHLIKLQKQNLDDLLKAEQEKLQETRQRSMEVANFQKLQVKDCDNIKQLEKSEDKEEGKTLKDQFDVYCNTKKTIANKHRQKKKALQEFYKNEIQLKREKEQEDLLKEEAENEKIQKFVKAKKKMANMRKEKEQQIFDNFQEHTEMMRSKLQDSMQQQIDDEDDRIAKAVAEREQKRMEELNRKQQKQKDSLHAMKNHRIQMMTDSNHQQQENKAKDQMLLQQRIKQDNKFFEDKKKERKEKRQVASKLQSTHKDQMFQKEDKSAKERNEQLEVDKNNKELLVKEEEIFQNYADKVITNATDNGRNPFPLIKAAREGPGGGRGPKFEGNAGLRPSYIVADATGVQLPHYLKDESVGNRVYGHVGKSGTRLGFTW